MSDTAVFDPTEVEQFAGQLMSIYTGTMLNYMIDIGHRTGLFTAAANGAATSQDLADRAGLTERYVREWLAAMVTGTHLRLRPLDRRVHDARRSCRRADRCRHEPRPDGRARARTSASTCTKSRARSARAAACRTPSTAPSSPT